MAKILILGGGFGGLSAAEHLAVGLGDSHQITLVSNSPTFTFYPGLVQLAFGEIEKEDISLDLNARLSRLGVRFVQGDLVRLHPGRRRAEITGDEFTGEIGYDLMVLALGRRLATEKVPGFFEHAHHLLGTRAALRFKEAIDSFTEGTIVAGLCPGARLPVPVCETAFALARKFETAVKDGRINIKIIFPRSVKEAFGGADLHKELEAAFARHRISVLYDVPITEIHQNEVISSEKHRIKYDLLMLVPPFRGQAILGGHNVLDDEDFVEVDDFMRVRGLDDAYAVGDMVAFDGPKFAHMAVRQAEVASANLVSRLAGGDPVKEYYHEIATIIDAGGPDSIYLHYGIWDESLHRLKKGRFWSIAKSAHDAIWRSRRR